MIAQLVDLLRNYGHFVAFTAAAIALYRHFRYIFWVRDNPPWKTGEDLRGDRRDVLGGLGETARKRRERGDQ